MSRTRSRIQGVSASVALHLSVRFLTLAFTIGAVVSRASTIGASGADALLPARSRASAAGVNVRGLRLDVLHEIRCQPPVSVPSRSSSPPTRTVTDDILESQKPIVTRSRKPSLGQG